MADVRAPTSPYSLRAILWIGLTVCLTAGLTSVFVLVLRITALTEERGEIRQRYHDAVDTQERRDAAVVEQALASRAYAATGDREMLAALQGARQRELEAAVALENLLTAADREILAGGAALRDAGDRALAGQRRRFELTIAVGVAALLLVVTGAFVTIGWVLRRTAFPLERLARAATEGASFPVPDDTPRVREVDALAWALHELDLAVRVRSEELAAAHHQAVELSRFGEHIQQVVDQRDVVEGLSARLIEVTGASAIHTLVREVGGDRLEVAQSSTGPTDRLQLPILAEPMKCRAARTLKPVARSADASGACRCPLVPERGAYLCEPMLAAGEVIGVVNLQLDDPAHLDEHLQHRVEASLRFAAPALASLRLFAAARERVLRDPVTDAYNRAFLDEFLGKQLAIANRSKHGVSLVAIDLDDRCDRALIAAVAAIHRTVRTSDAVVRDADARLLVVLPDTDLEGACLAAERIQAALGVPTALGVAAFPDHGDTVGALVEAVDRALYRAKVSGKDGVTSAETRDTSAFHVPTRPN